MRVILCEKPSQAQDIADVLADGRELKHRTGWFETDGVAVTWCIGHLYRQCNPEDYESSLKAWTIDTLPIVPNVWQLKPREGAGRQIDAIRQLLGRATEIVIATDPDREGEVIGREVLDEMIWRGPVSRLLLSALDPASIRTALAQVRPGRETEALYYAGLGRSRADWIIGINLTRAWTLAGRQQGMKGVLSVGRVQTPTLNLVVSREEAIRSFVPTTFHVVEAICSPGNSGDSLIQFRAVWNPGPEHLDKHCDSEGRCTDPEVAMSVAAELSGVPGKVVSADSEQKADSPPLPYSLSMLQQAASALWGYGAKQTAGIAQALYERHKAISYPRADTGYLPVNQFAAAGEIVDALQQAFQESDDNATVIPRAIAGADLKLKSRAWNDSRVTAHHGIIPTVQAPRIDSLTEEERNLYTEIATRFLLQFWPVHEFEQTRLEIEAGGYSLKASGRRTVVIGWKEITAREAQDTDDDSNDGQPGTGDCQIPWIPVGGDILVSQADLLRRKTRPPAPYTQGTLIRAMSNIASEVEDPETRKLLRDHDGIGTDATRADVIQVLLDRKYIRTVHGKLRSTAAGQQLIAALPVDIRDPGTTAIMEKKLSAIESGDLSLKAFIDSQVLFVTRQVELARHTVSRAKASGSKASSPTTSRSGAGTSQVDLGSCPECGKPLRKKMSKHGPFIGCSGYPGCRYIRKDGKPSGSRSSGGSAGKSGTVIHQVAKCPECGSAMVERRGAKGPFLGCASYPDCRGTRKIPASRQQP